MYEIKTENVYKDFCKDKAMFGFSNYSAKSKYYDDLNKLVVRKMKNKTVGVPLKEFVWLKPNIYSFWEDDSNEHKKAKDVNKNVVAIMGHSEHKSFLLNIKCLMHSMNRIQDKNHRIGTCKIKIKTATY